MSFRRLIGKILLLLVMLLVLVSGLTIPGCRELGDVPRGWSGVVVADGALFLGSMEGKLVAIDESNQDRLWDVPFESTKQTGGFGCAQAPESVAIYGTPVVAGDLVYVAGYNGKLYAINATGEKRWEYPPEAELEPIVGGPAVALGKVYIGCSDGKLYALDAATGGREWKFETGDKIWSTLSANGDTVYIGSFDKKLYALDAADGRKKWEFPTEGAIVATPLVYDGTVYIGSFDRYLYALNATDGSLRWKFLAENWFWARPVADNGVIYAGSVDGKVYALKTENGDKIAEFDLGSPVISSPVLADGAIIVASEEGKVYSLDITSNQESRTANQRQLANLEEKIHAPLAAGNGVVYIHSDKDVLYAVDIQSGVTQWSLSLKSE